MHVQSMDCTMVNMARFFGYVQAAVAVLDMYMYGG